MVAYISRLNYPDPSANALQTIRMAAALSEQRRETALFVHDLGLSEDELRRLYGITASPLKIWRMHTRQWPVWFYNQGVARFVTYNSAAALLLGLHAGWRRLPQQHKTIFVRSRLETLYWGLARPYLWWLRDWLFVCEIHDLPGPPAQGGAGEAISSRMSRAVRALQNYDLVIALTHGLAEELQRITEDRVRFEVLPLCTGLPRLVDPPEIRLPAERIILGYTGTIDRSHGIPDLLQALERLPQNFVLRLSGRVREDADALVQAACGSGRVELAGHIPYAQVADEIDRCHLALAPAGSSVHALHYRSPLKIFDYMARGKPVLAADAPCHQELLQDGVNAVFFRSGDPQDLAEKILDLAHNPDRMQSIACEAWRTSERFTYPARAAAMLQLFDQAREQLRKGTRDPS